MTKMKLFALSAVIVLISSTILSACQTALSTEQIQNTMNAAVNQTMTAMPTATKVPTATATQLHRQLLLRSPFNMALLIFRTTSTADRVDCG